MPLPLSSVAGAVSRFSTACILRSVLPARQQMLRIKRAATNPIQAFSCLSSRLAPTITGQGLVPRGHPAGTERVVGAAVLGAVLHRHISSHLKKSATEAPIAESMTEPYGELIRSMQADLLKLDFIKVQENKYSMLFSDGSIKLELAITDRFFHPCLSAILIKNNGDHHHLAVLREALNSPETRQEEMEARNTIMEQHGMWKADTPKELNDKGERACLLLDLKQTVSFLALYKKIAAQQSLDLD